MRGQCHASPALYPRGKDPVPIVQEAGWAPEPVCTGAENLAPTGIQSPDRPALSQSMTWTYLVIINCLMVVIQIFAPLIVLGGSYYSYFLSGRKLPFSSV